jgi:hypothetical protein
MPAKEKNDKELKLHRTACGRVDFGIGIDSLVAS